ncbi:MAG: phosphoribosyltransferase [Acidimicrobiia bacterium]
MRFDDRRDAGARLGAEVAEMKPVNPAVYALPRGGVPVGFEVARSLGCPLDVLIVRKVGVPFQPELAMGAIAEGNIVIRNEEIISQVGIDDAHFEKVLEAERENLERRIAVYRADAAPISPTGRTAIVVDDGLATGSTALAAVAALEAKGAAAVWLAVPVAPRGVLAQFEGRTDRVVVLSSPHGFGAVGVWYRDFSQTGDDEVRSLLASSRLA